MASAVRDLLIGKLVTILEDEGTAIAGVRDEVDKIKEEFLSMKAFLKDAEANKAKSEGEKLWVARIRDLAYDVEDIIDEFLYHTYEKQTGSRLLRGLDKTIRAPKNLWHRRKIAKKLQKITEMIKKAIPEWNERYGVTPGAGASASEDIHKLVQNQADSAYFIAEEELVGIEGKKQILMGWLMDPNQHQSIISVVGMGGSGKTTLVAKTFHDESIKRHFDCCAWITVSETYDEGHLLRSLIREFHKSTKEDFSSNLDAMSPRELKGILINYLESKTYLVVLDDVWDINVWKEMKVSLQDRLMRSRIVLTTRKEEVAVSSYGVKSYVHRIQPLGEDEAWKLFCKKAFSTNQHTTCPTELESLAWQLVDKCEGLPLAIVALGGLMSSKSLQDEWQQICNSLNWHLDNNSSLGPMKNILLLSFNDLSSQLKHCFLFCSLFPEDYSMKRKRLINLWIAEGFVSQVKGLTLEDVADEHLRELCFRSMLQVVKRNEIGRPKQVKMHDLMRELALLIAEKEKFGVVYDGKEAMEDISTRRLAIHKLGEVNSWPGMSKIRSLLVFATDMSSLSFLNTLLSQSKLLRSLDLEGVQIDKLPDSVVFLFNLRYLNLKDTSIKELPESIWRLRNLQFLNLKHSKIESLPQGITKSLNLRRLIMYRLTSIVVDFNFVSGIKGPSNICKLQKLQSLAMIEAEGDTSRLIGNLTQLRTLGISNLKEGDEIELWISIRKLTLLRTLTLMASDEREILPVTAQRPLLPRLQKLFLIGKLRSVVIPWFSSLHNLTILDLRWSRLEDDFLPHIEALPNLTLLSLWNAYAGQELCFRRGFVKLVTMHLGTSTSLEKITIGKGVMPKLRELRVRNCKKLKTVPQGLEYLSNLQSLVLEDVPREIIQSIRKGGADRAKVQHIPEIRHFYEDGRFYENLAE